MKVKADGSVIISSLGLPMPRFTMTLADRGSLRSAWEMSGVVTVIWPGADSGSLSITSPMMAG